MDKVHEQAWKSVCGYDNRQLQEKKALLLHIAGDEVFEIYGMLDNTGDKNGFDETKQALTNYFKPKINTEFEIFEFRQMKQME